MGLDPGDGGVLGGRQNAGAVLDGDDAIDHRVRRAARHHGADVALGRRIDVEDQKFVVVGVGDRDRCAGEIGRIRQVRLIDELKRIFSAPPASPRSRTLARLTSTGPTPVWIVRCGPWP